MGLGPDIAWRGELDALRKRVNAVLASSNNYVHTIQIVHSTSAKRNDPLSRILSCQPGVYEAAVKAFVREESESFSRSLVGRDWEHEPYWYGELGSNPIFTTEQDLSFRPIFQGPWEFKNGGEIPVTELVAEWRDKLAEKFSDSGATMWVTQSHHERLDPSVFPTSSAFVVFNRAVAEISRYPIAKLLRDFLVRMLAEMYHEEIGKLSAINVSLLHEVLKNPSTTRSLGNVIVKQLKAYQKAIVSPYPMLVTGASGTGKMWVTNQIHEIRDRYFSEAGNEDLKDGHGPYLINVSELPTERKLIRQSIMKQVGWPRSMSQDKKLKWRGKGVVVFDDIHLASATAQDVIRQILDKAFTTIPEQDPDWLPMRKPIFVALPGLSVAAAGGRFNSSLYAQISAFEVRCPPLHQRKDDLRELLPGIIKAISGALRLENDFQLSKDATSAIVEKEWPGNFHELHGYLIRKMLYSEDGED